MDNRALQEDELLVLESIYNSDEFEKRENSDLLGGHLNIYHELPKNFKIIVKSYKQSGETEYREIQVSKVPPIDLEFSLPINYPSESPPDYIISCPWLTPLMLSELCLKLDKLWLENKGSEILFIWVDFLKENVFQLFCKENSITVDDLSTAHFGEKSLINALSCLTIASSTSTNDYIAISKSSSCSSTSVISNCSERIEFQSDNIADVPEANECCESSSKISTADPVNNNVCDRRVLIKNVDTPLHVSLNEYNLMKTQEELMKSQVTCNSCFDEKSGMDCTQFNPCCHVFCKACVSSYFETQIRENRIFSLGCLENNCDSSATQAQIKEHVEEALFNMYDKLLLDASLLILTDIVYCPRKFCNYPVTREPNEKLAICPECKYPFCVLCKMTYHGIENCRFASGEKRALVLAYQNGDKKQREELELRYGHRQLQALLFDELSTQWISHNSKTCPNCSSPIEKNDGCNKMTCTKCGVFFCWVCGTCLSQDRPYDHFSNPTSRCFNQLFEGANVEEDEYEIFFDDHEIGEQFRVH